MMAQAARPSAARLRVPTRKRATSSIGFCVADSPMRVRRRPASASSRSSESARCAPRLLRCHGVDLVDDHRARAREHRAPGGRAHEDVERLGRRHHDVRRAPAHRRALVLRGVPGAHEGADVELGKPERGELGADARERRLEVLVDVVRERLERGDVDDEGLIRERAGRQRPRAPAHRSRRGRPRASCPSRWGRRSARAAVRWICGHAAACAAVGVPKARANQRWTAG